LAVESKLQLISAYQETRFTGTPLWLMQLAVADNAAVVRYWAARHYRFTDETDRLWPPNVGALNSPTDDLEKKLHTQLAEDSSDLVKACTAKKLWDKENYLGRLVFIRSKGSPGLVSGLNSAFDAGLSDDDLAGCFQELIARKEIIEDLNSKREFAEGDVAYYEGKVVKDGWALVAKAGPKLQRLLAHYLPTYRGLGYVTAETLASMPIEVLEVLAFRETKTAETKKALELVMSNPEKYGEAAAATVKTALENLAQWEEANSRGDTPPTMQGTQEATLALVEALNQQISGLAEQLSALQQQISGKKGLFF
jgi:hypothetical protein